MDCVGLDWAAFGKLPEILDISICLMRKVYGQCMLQIMTEPLRLTKKLTENLRVTQRTMGRAMLGITKRDTIPNNTIRQRTKVKD